MFSSRIITAITLAGLGSAAMAADWNEAIDGDLSTDTLAPTFVSFDLGANTIIGDAGGLDNWDVFAFTIAEGNSLESVILNDWVGVRTNGGIAPNTPMTFISGNSWGGPFSGEPTLGSTQMREGTIGADMLLGGGPNAPVGGPLGPGDYVVAIQESIPGHTYSLSFNVVPAPGVMSAMAVGGLALVRRRRACV